MTSEYRQSTRKFVEFSCGPLRWRSGCVRSTSERDGALTLDTFADELRALIALALDAGCARRDIDTLLGQYLNGDHHGDA